MNVNKKYYLIVVYVKATLVEMAFIKRNFQIIRKYANIKILNTNTFKTADAVAIIWTLASKSHIIRLDSFSSVYLTHISEFKNKL